MEFLPAGGRLPRSREEEEEEEVAAAVVTTGDKGFVWAMNERALHLLSSH